MSYTNQTEQMEPHFDPINASILQDNLGFHADDAASSIDLTPEEVIDGQFSAVETPPRRKSNAVATTVLAASAIAVLIGGGAFYVLSTAGEPAPAELLAAAMPQPAPVATQAPVLPIGGPDSLADAKDVVSTEHPASEAPGQNPFAAPTGAVDMPPQAPTAPAATEVVALPNDLAALAAGAQPPALDANANPASAPMTPATPKEVAPAPQPASAPVQAAVQPVIEKPAVAVVKPAAQPKPKAAEKAEVAPQKTVPAKTAPAPIAEVKKPVAPRPAAPVAKIAPKPSNVELDLGSLSGAATDTVKPLIIMSAQQIGLRALTRDSLVIASASGAEDKTYRAGSTLPSGERIEILDAASMVIVTDRNVIRIKP